MIRVALFVEGQSELIFVRKLLNLVAPETASFKCIRLLADRECHAAYDYPLPNPNADFLIVDVGNDSRVLSAIRDREQNLFNKGYDYVLGLRDLYSEAYSKLSNVIDPQVTSRFLSLQRATIQQMSRPGQITVHFAIMELEAWFLGMYPLFLKLDPRLTEEFIRLGTGLDLPGCDPQDTFFHPANEIQAVLRLVGRDYQKREHDVEALLAQLDTPDLAAATAHGRCATLDTFLAQIRSLAL